MWLCFSDGLEGTVPGRLVPLGDTQVSAGVRSRHHCPSLCNQVRTDQGPWRLQDAGVSNI